MASYDDISITLQDLKQIFSNYNNIVPEDSLILKSAAVLVIAEISPREFYYHDYSNFHTIKSFYFHSRINFASFLMWSIRAKESSLFGYRLSPPPPTPDYPPPPSPPPLPPPPPRTLEFMKTVMR